MLESEKRRYAKARVAEVLRIKIVEFRESCTSTAKQLSGKDTLDAIRYGNVELKRNAIVKTPLDEAFDFSQLKREFKVDQERLDKGVKKLRAEAGRITDLVVLGDEKKAWAAVAVFCKGR